MKTISLCLIMKDEGNNIRRCLKSVQDVVNEIIVVDTGSTDESVEICREFGAQVYEFQWKEDFSEARNFALEKASGDWILWMDADEELYVSGDSILQQSLEEINNDCLSVRIMNLHGTYPAKEQRSYRSSNYRLFLNGKGFRFRGKIHEVLDIGQQSAVTFIPGIRILHYGYMEETLTSKTGRNLKMLQTTQSEQVEDPWLDYYFAAEYYRTEEYEKVLELVNNAMLGFLKKGILPPSLAYRLKYQTLLAVGSYEQAYHGIDKAITLYPGYVDLYFYKGLLQYGREEYERAVITFSYCLILGEEHPEYLILTGTGSFFALYWLGLAYERLEEHEKAEEAICRAQKLYPEVIIEGKRFELKEVI